MGNIFSKPKAKQRIVDGGASLCTNDRKLAEPERVASTRSRPPRKDYKVREVSNLIKHRKLAPFYEGLADCSNCGEMKERAAICEAPVNHDPGGEIDARDGNIKNDTENQKKHKSLFMIIKRRFLLALEHDSSELAKHESSIVALDPAWLKECLIECPICFLFFPRNINWTACCHKPMCTFCFLHIRRPPSGREITCPFCNATGFTVRYVPPDVMRIHKLTRIPDRESMPKEASKVTLESIRIKLPPQPPQTRRMSMSNRVIGIQNYPGQYHHRRQYSSNYANYLINPNSNILFTGQRSSSRYAHNRQRSALGQHEVDLFYIPPGFPPGTNFLFL